MAALYSQLLSNKYSSGSNQGEAYAPEDGSLVEALTSFLNSSKKILDAGFEQSKFVPATFFFRDSKGQLKGMLAVHVDDGVWAGSLRTLRQPAGCAVLFCVHLWL